jgi:CDP-diacylglycerol--glycerol-3-phosphate 3-phosphatidyltransferase
MLTDTAVRPFRWLVKKLASGLATTRIHPDLLTWLSLFLNTWAGAFFAAGRFAAAGAILIAAGFCDMMDGPVARRQGRVTEFGSFLHSILNRYADLVLFLGLLVYYARVNRFLYAVLAGVAMAGAVMVSYAQARAESLIEKSRVGFWERPERIVLMILGALVNRMPLVLWILAIGPNVTVIHRILHTWSQTEGRLREKQAAAEKPAAEPEQVPEARILTRTAGHGG